MRLVSGSDTSSSPGAGSKSASSSSSRISQALAGSPQSPPGTVPFTIRRPLARKSAGRRPRNPGLHVHILGIIGYSLGRETEESRMSGTSWSDIPTDLQARIVAGDSAVLNPLAAWLHEHPPRHVSPDVIQKTLDTLRKLMSSEQGRSLLVSTRSIASFLATLAA